VAMKYFTHEWAASDDENADALVKERYLQSVENFPESVRTRVRAIVRDKDFRDALLDCLEVDSVSHTVRLTLIDGDNEKGYFRTTISYSGATIRPGREETCAIFTMRSVRVRFDEFEMIGRMQYAHRFLLWPKACGELDVEFGEIEIRSVSINGRHYGKFGSFVVWK
jgi:hypothetical protein